MLLAGVDLLVENHAVEALLGRLGNQLFRQRNVLFGGETEAVDDALDLVFGRFDALGNLHLLLARQQRHLAHLLEIHADRIVQDVEPPFLVLLVRFGLFDAVHLRLVNNLDLQIAQLDVDLVQFLRPDEGLGQRLVDIVVGQVALLLGQADQFLDLLRDLKARRGAVEFGASGLARSGAMVDARLWRSPGSPSIWP